jgi:hypothetical protein
MKKYLLIFTAALFLWGCIAEDRTACANPRGTFVSLTVRPERMFSVTRSADEYAIRDLNFYLYDDNGEVVLHRYQTSATLRFECLPGNYRMRIAANLNRDLGESPISEDFTVTHRDTYDALPMAWDGDVTIPASGGSLPTVEVQRAVAKISYDITVKPSDIELLSVQLLSVPRTVSIFDVEAAPSDDPDDYMDCPETHLSGRSAAGTSYLLPNMQGTVPSITDQRAKNADNAPENASYLLIRAVRGAKALAYYVYLGENNTSDFNVRANTHYRFNISILGDSEVDTRVSSYELNVYDTYGDNMIGGYCTYDIMGELFIEVDGDLAPLTLRGHISASQGDTDRFLVDDASIGSGLGLNLPNQPGLNEYFLYYDQPVYTEANSQVNYTVTVEDDGGYTQSFDFERRFANKLDVIVDTFDNGKGKVTVSDALYSEQVSGTRDHVVMCHQMGCTLVALPAAGYRFDGWYTTDGYTTRLSISTTYFYVPKSTDASIFPKFTAQTVPLDDDGTANCYIAPQRGTSYSFGATVQGNGRSTTNIWPVRLSGTSARVLWETGTVRGAVIEDAEYQSGRIVFTTGTDRGNALIGLFDSRGNCIWSWHIWAVDYDIEASARTYESGAVFMDRNLGALTTDYMQPASRGLYYQWGRKDPFLYPATCQDIVKRADAVYAAGFEYAVSEPRNAATESPYDVMTVEWSITHPTTFMNNAMYEDWEEWTSVADWLYGSHPNLWGNVTTSNDNISRVSQKSIYDPCPVGWKVPSPEDFRGITGVSQSMPYYVTISYNGSSTTNIPLGGTYADSRYMGNGQIGRLYSNAPYHMRWESDTSLFYDTACTSILFSSGSYPPYIGTSDYYRYAANPVRCIRE